MISSRNYYVEALCTLFRCTVMENVIYAFKAPSYHPSFITSIYIFAVKVCLLFEYLHIKVNEIWSAPTQTMSLIILVLALKLKTRLVLNDGSHMQKQITSNVGDSILFNFQLLPVNFLATINCCLHK